MKYLHPRSQSSFFYHHLNKLFSEISESNDNTKIKFGVVPSFSTVLNLLQETQQIFLGEEKKIACKVICSRFLLKLIHASGLNYQGVDDESSDSDDKNNKRGAPISTQKSCQLFACLWRANTAFCAFNWAYWCRQKYGS